MNYPPQEAQVPKPRRLYKPKPVTPLSQQATGIVNVPDVQLVQDEKSWLRQQGDDLMAIVTGIPNLLWHTAKSYGELDYGAVLDGLTRDPVAVGRATQETLGQMLEGATAHWRGKDDKATLGSVLSAPIRRPILAGLDLLTVLSLGSAAGIKMAPLAGKVAVAARGGKAATDAAKVARAAAKTRARQAAAGSSGRGWSATIKGEEYFGGPSAAPSPEAVTAAKEMIDVYRATSKVIPEEVSRRWASAFKAAQEFPLAIVKSGLGKVGQLPVVKPLLESVGWDAQSLDLNYKGQTAKMQYTGRDHEMSAPVVQQAVGKELYEDLIDIEAGYKALNPNIHPPEVVERMRAFAKVVAEIEDDSLRAALRAASGEYNSAAMEGAKLNKLKDRMRAKGIPEEQLTDDLVKLHRDSVLAEAEALGTGDIQRHMYHHGLVDNATSLDDLIMNVLEPMGSQTMRKAGVLERFLGRSKYKTNPNIRQVDYIRSHNEMLGRVAYIRTIMGEPNVVKVMHRNAITPDRVEMPEVLSKNIDYHREALTLVAREIAEAELKHGVGSPEAIAAAILKSQDGLGDVARRMADDIVDGAMKDTVITVPKNVARLLNNEMMPSGPFGRLYDKGMNFWRDLVLTFMPRYYVNNLLGNSLLMLLGGYKPGSVPGRDLEKILGREMTQSNIFIETSGLSERIGASPMMAKIRNKLADAQYATENRPRALMALKRIGANVKDIEVTDELARLVGMEGGAMPTLERAMEFAIRARELEVKMKGAMLAEGRFPLPEAPQVSTGIAPEVAGAFKAQADEAGRATLAKDIRASIERMKGGQKILDQLEPFAKQADEAYKWVETFLGPYGKLTPFARKYIRGVVPFWTFGSTMARLMFHMPLLRPKTTWLYNSMSQMALDAWDDERLPDYLRGSIWVGTGKNGMMYFTRMTGFNPLESLSERKFGGVSIPALLDPTQSPLIGAILKMSGGYDQFSHNPPPLEPDQMIDHQGRVWDIDPRTGSPKRVSPQTPFLDALGEMIPQTSILNDIMAHSGFQVPGRGPKLYQMPDGTMFNPRHWQWGLANGLMRSFGASVMPVNIQKAKAQQRMQAIRLIRHLGKQAVRAAEPEERAQFMKMAKYALEGLHAK